MIMLWPFTIQNSYSHAVQYNIICIQSRHGIRYTRYKKLYGIRYTFLGDTALTQQLYLYYVRYSIRYSPSWVPPPALQYKIH